MKTSYFSKYKGTEAVAISGGIPLWYKGRWYNQLAPKYWFFQKYKKDRDKEHYIECYNRDVLGQLDAQTVYNQLGEDAVLLCYEKSGEFCHRRLVADWFKRELGIDVPEL